MGIVATVKSPPAEAPRLGKNRQFGSRISAKKERPKYRVFLQTLPFKSQKGTDETYQQLRFLFTDQTLLLQEDLA